MKMLGGCKLVTVMVERLPVMTKITKMENGERIVVEMMAMSY